MLLEFSENSQENTCACNFIKKEILAQVFSCEFCEVSKNTFLHRTPLVAASVSSFQVIWLDQISPVTKGGCRTAATSKIPAVNYYHKALHLGCCSSPRSAFGNNIKSNAIGVKYFCNNNETWGITRFIDLWLALFPSEFFEISKNTESRTSTWVFSCKFAAYFRNTFLKNTSGRLLLDSKQVKIETS